MNVHKAEAGPLDASCYHVTAFTQEAPFLPKVKSKKDLANFSVHPDEMPRFIEYVDDGSGPLTWYMWMGAHESGRSVS